MNPRAEMEKLLREIEEVLPKVEWKVRDDVLTQEAHEFVPRMFDGHAPGDWYFVVSDFEIESQGFPKGSRGYDGCGRNGAVVIRLTRELAERAVKLALSKTSTLPAPPDLTANRERDTNDPHRE
jgi:hypothetical protein